MKIIETCSCTAAITVEDTDAAAARTAHLEWVARHHCDGHNPWQQDKAGSTGGQFGFGFQRAVWDPHHAVAGPSHQFGGGQ